MDNERKKEKVTENRKKKFLINNHILMIKKCQSLCQNRGEKKYFQQ
jgi:hypothetical protein